MSSLVLHGIDVGRYLAAVPERRSARAGGFRRAFGGGLRNDTIAKREGWVCRTVPVSRELANALRGMFDGKVNGWVFNDWFSNQGETVVDTEGATLIGSEVEISYPAGYIAFAGSGDYTVLIKIDEGAGYTRWIIRSDEDAWNNGAAAPIPSWMQVGTNPQILNDTGSGLPVEEVVVLPFLLPPEWVQETDAEFAARSLASWHKIRATGDLMPDAPRTVRGVVGESSFVPNGRDGVWTATDEVIEFTLEDY